MATVIRGSDNFDSGEAFGQNQTWQDVSASRSGGVTYTNTSGRAIMVAVSVERSTGNSISITVDGISGMLRSGASLSVATQLSLSIIIPDGSTYNMDIGGGVISSWVELR